MNKAEYKSPLAPLFQRGEQISVPLNLPASPFEKGGSRGICRCGVLRRLSEVWVA